MNLYRVFRNTVEFHSTQRILKVPTVNNSSKSGVPILRF